MKFLVVGFGLTTILFLVASWALRRVRTRQGVPPDQLWKYVAGLLSRGWEGDGLRVEIPDTKAYLQYAKYKKSDGGAGLELGFSRASWSERYWPALMQTLLETGYEGREVEARRKLGREVQSFYIVDLQQNVHAAARLAQIVLEWVFGLSPHQEVTVSFRKASPWDQRRGF